MQHLIDAVGAALASMSPLETASVVFAILYLLLVIRENIWCWAAGLVSVLLSLVLFWQARLYMESALQVFYAAMSVYGWYEWRYGGQSKEGVPIRLWPPRTHVATLATIAALTGAFGVYLLRYSNEARPFVDSFTTIGALFATYMVAQKVLENWVYWFVIDGVSVYLYASRGLFLYAALFVFYLVMIVVGFRAWSRQRRAEEAERAGRTADSFGAAAAAGASVRTAGLDAGSDGEGAGLARGGY